MKVSASPVGTLEGLSTLRQALSDPKVAGFASLLHLDLSNQALVDSVLSRAENNLQVAAPSSSAAVEPGLTAMAAGRQAPTITWFYVARALKAYQDMATAE